MRRRTLFTGLAAVGAAGTAAAVVGPMAMADAANYYVAVTEQVQNKVMIFARNSPWNDAHMARSFSPGGGGWSNLSDVKFRNTTRYGAVGLVTASGGNVGVWNITDEKHQEHNDLLWSASPGGNPHAIERIPNNGSVVTASSGGYLTLYAPGGSSMGSLAKVKTYDFAGAHGVLWDDIGKLLWAVGRNQVRAFKVTGSGRGTRLADAGRHHSLPGLGHDLQPDYHDHTKLLATDGRGVYQVDRATAATKQISGTNGVKSYCRHASGDSFWAIPNWGGHSNWRTNTIGFSNGYKRTRSGAGFYKARLFKLEFH
ncbi:MAG TPA: DUF6528 family protein [Stackebrandtia sp.]|jgi:hypothetical protein|uniref:DUF6528 family protein n=1 Tax=Stackebrandtia sp. TaxID=2023065 RepID=UPI002D3D6065|nr:DUF6528 family protein [Stackebrandtia sp.]HZE39536.1 DUF6528 family protein [Stackebrandtia sp.]